MSEDFSTLPTEAAQGGPALDQLPTLALLQRLHAADATISSAVAACLPELARVVDATAARLRAGGHLHYFGAGTSGRLGVLDASEIPPTFGVTADLVQGHMAGGPDALLHAVEGAEDSRELGAEAVNAAGISAQDVVVAISASGRTPYALGVLAAAQSCGALRVALVCAADSAMAAAAEHTLCADTGAEVLSGSTRLKAGTAQKLVLNMLSTAVMTRLGRTYGELMVGVQASNAKLRARAARIVAQITGTHEAHAALALEHAGGDARVASLMLLRDLPPADARRRLDACNGSLRAALG